MGYTTRAANDAKLIVLKKFKMAAVLVYGFEVKLMYDISIGFTIIAYDVHSSSIKSTRCNMLKNSRWPPYNIMYLKWKLSIIWLGLIVVTHDNLKPASKWLKMQYYDNFKMAAIIDIYEFAAKFQYNKPRNPYSYICHSQHEQKMTRNWLFRKIQDGRHTSLWIWSEIKVWYIDWFYYSYIWYS